MSAPGSAADGGRDLRPGFSAAGPDAARQAERLLRWYPRIWRDRYGEEFAELLVSEIEERPHAAGRTLDVVRGGIVARLSAAGLCGVPLRDSAAAMGTPATQPSAGTSPPAWSRLAAASRSCSASAPRCGPS